MKKTEGHLWPQGGANGPARANAPASGVKGQSARAGLNATVDAVKIDIQISIRMHHLFVCFIKRTEKLHRMYQKRGKKNDRVRNRAPLWHLLSL